MNLSTRSALRLLAVCLAGFRVLSPLMLRAEKPDVRAKVVVPSSAAPGSRATLVVEMTAGPNWHVNSHTPGEKFLIPTDVTLTSTTGTLSSVRYPAYVKKRFAFSDTPMLVYEGTVRFEADLSLPADARGTASIAGNLSFQACNDRQCFPPAKIPLEAAVVVSPAENPPPSR